MDDYTRKQREKAEAEAAEAAAKADAEARAKARARAVKMTRPEGLAKGGPTTADVAPEEVEGFEAVGWRLAPTKGKGKGDSDA